MIIVKLPLLLLFLSLQQLFALISIVPVDIGSTPGTSGKVEAGLDTIRGNTDKDTYKIALRINYDNNSSFVFWSELSGEYGKANGVENTSKIYSHIRYIYALTDKTLRGELFLQGEEDKFKALAKRRLAGGGLRYQLFENFTGLGKGYFGMGAFYEYIRHIDSNIDPKEDNIRVNSYIAHTTKFNEDSNFAYTMYYQPRIDKFSDYAISNKLELQFHIYLHLFLKFSVYYDVDSLPPTSIKHNYDFGQSTTFVYDF